MTGFDIPEDDSEDLLDEEVERAIVTTDTSDLSKKIVAYLQEHSGEQLNSHELRRRKPHLYWRSRIIPSTGDPHTIVFQVDWLGPK